MNNVNKTLYIPLYGKAYVSKKGLFCKDKKAEEIWGKEKFPLKGKSKSKWLAYYMGIRAAVFDDWLRKMLNESRDAIVLHIGCGMDSRVLRVGTCGHKWYDLDFPEVIQERKRYYEETLEYKMIAGDIRNGAWLSDISETKNLIVVMEGVSMYLNNSELRVFLKGMKHHFENVHILMDCYTEFAAKMSKYKNPINDVGVTQVFGVDHPEYLSDKDYEFVKEHNMIPYGYIDQLSGMEKFIFAKLYAGKMSKKLYRLYEFRSIPDERKGL